MALFQKKTVAITTPSYTIGNQLTKLVIGLGNVGDKYQLTRHNAGFLCLDDFAEREEFNPWIEKKDLKSALCAKLIGDTKVILCKPTTMMNLSGVALAAVQRFYRITDEDTCVVQDELALDFGIIRVGKAESDAGHNGIKSVIEHTLNSLWRIRVGIGPKRPQQIDSSDFVLKKFSAKELEYLPAIQKEVANLLQDWLSGNHKADTRSIK